MRRWPGLVASALEAIADADAESAVIVHCGAGRDRTGMISALLLAAAGVQEEAILDDYETGVRSIARHFASMDAPPEPLLPDADLDALILTSRRELSAFLDGTTLAGLLKDVEPGLRAAAGRLR